MKTTLSHPKARPALERLFWPQTIAVIGASEEEGSVGYEVMKNLLAGHYQGALHPVNPKYAGEISQHLKYAPESTIRPYARSAGELPTNGAIDLAIILTPAPTVPGIVSQLGEKGVKAVVVISAGFTEIGNQGENLVRELRQALDRYGITMVGPNCLGVANMATGVSMNATFARTTPRPGRGAIFSQSGAVGIDLINRASAAGLGFSQFVSLGNSLDIGPSDLLAAWQADPAIHYVLGYLESGPLLANLRDVASRFTPAKPLLMIKAGRSSAGAQAASSHTGALAGNEEAVDALLRQYGIQRFNTIETMMAAATAFEYCPPLKGNRVAVLSNAGGYAVMTADLILAGGGKSSGLALAEFSDDTHQQIDQLLPSTASDRNPVDTTATFPVDSPDRFGDVLSLMADDPQVDACLVELIPLMDLPIGKILTMAAEVQAHSHKPIICVLAASDPAAAETSTIARYTTLEDAVAGLSALNRHRLWQERPRREMPLVLPDIDRSQATTLLSHAHKEGRALLTTAESLSVLKAYGIQTPEFQITKTRDEAVAIAQTIGYPLAIKLNSKTVTHKTDVGGVRVDIRDEAELRDAFNTMMIALQEAGIERFAEGEGIMLQRYLPSGRELILGIKTDPDFGKLILIGRGGIYTQIDQDFQIRLSPLTRLEVREMIRQLKAYPILKGYRGKPGIDFENLEETLLRLAALATDYPEISELDINPYLALPQAANSGAAVDARIFLSQSF